MREAKYQTGKKWARLKSGLGLILGGDQAIEVSPVYGKKAVLLSPASVGRWLRVAPNVRCRDTAQSSGGGSSSQQWTLGQVGTGTC